jgi:2-amino-4-hydroxy-6-hydroxymethyldihydropteridine diphosphokinase
LPSNFRSEMKQPLYILIGSNLEKPELQLADACRRLQSHLGIILKQSSLYRTAAWGMTDQPDFLNQVLKFESDMDAENLMSLFLSIESDMGRIRTEKNAPRKIDIDILSYGNLQIQKPALEIPHPRLAIRRFVLIPLQELEPNWQHPVTGEYIDQLLDACPDTLSVHLQISNTTDS